MCKSWGVIYPSRKDVLTGDTARQIAGNNVANEEWCGKKPVPKTASTEKPVS